MNEPDNLEVEHRREITQRSLDDPQKRHRVMSYEELLEGISDLARNGEGAQRAAAYRLLMTAQGQSGPILAEPMPETDMIDRLTRLMKAVGRRICQVCYHKAFTHAQDTIEAAPKFKIEDIDFKGIKLPQTLKQLYRMFPEIKGPGFPRGYPAGKSVVIKSQWCQLEAKKALRERREKQIQDAAQKIADDRSKETDGGEPQAS